jgi:hypothetical protein
MKGRKKMRTINYQRIVSAARAGLILKTLSVVLVLTVLTMTAAAQSRMGSPIKGTLTAAQQTEGEGFDFGTIEGTWIVNVNSGPNGPPPLLALHTYSTGGAMIESNQTDQQPPVQFAGQGTWVKLGPNVFGFTLIKPQYDAMGNVVASLKIRSILRLMGRDSFHGDSEVLICDAAYADCFSVGNSTDQGHRMQVEAPDLPK